MRGLALLAVVFVSPVSAARLHEWHAEAAGANGSASTGIPGYYAQIPSGCVDPGAQVEYLGAFRVPECWHGNEMQNPNTFEFGGAEIGYSPQGDDAPDGYPGTLYMSGYLRGTDDGNPANVHGGYFARLAIPVPQLDPVPEHLPLCTVIDSLADYDGQYLENMATVAATQRIGDILWLPPIGSQTQPHVYLSAWAKYNQMVGDVPTFFSNSESRTNLSHIWLIGPRAGTNRSSPWFCWKHCDFLFLVPRWWAEDHSGGRYLAIGNGDRDGGHVISGCGPGGCTMTCPNRYQDEGRIGVHLGPGFALIDPATVVSNPPDGTSIGASEASGYYQGHYVQRAWNDDYPGIDPFQDLDMFKEGAWISDYPLDPQHAGATHAVAFVVQKATHQCDYSNPVHCYTGPDACGLRETGSTYVSGHLDDGLPLPDVRAEMWFFDPSDYERVLAGTAAPWSPRAYAKLDLTSIFYQTRAGVCPTSVAGPNLHIGGVAYDPVNSLLYLAEGHAWANPNDHGVPKYPVVHVFKILAGRGGDMGLPDPTKQDAPGHSEPATARSRGSFSVHVAVDRSVRVAHIEMAGPSAAEPCHVTVHDIQGRLVRDLGTTTAERLEWPMHGVADGVYFVRVEGKTAAATGKIVVVE